MQDEFSSIKLDEQSLILYSTQGEVHIPFSRWSGSLVIRRGIVWGSLEIIGRVDDAIRDTWVVQGLPWSECKHFALLANDAHTQWREQRKAQLTSFLPQWRVALSSLLESKEFVSHAMVRQWRESIISDLLSVEMDIGDVIEHFGESIAPLLEWYSDTDLKLSQHNQQWCFQEIEQWQPLFSSLESQPLNTSQQQAIVTDDNHTLVLAGAGSGKTSVLAGKVAYLLESGRALPQEIVVLAFGKDAAAEMRARLRAKVGPATESVSVYTFHQLGLDIIRSVEPENASLSPMVGDEQIRLAWFSDWLKKHWMTPTNFKRWQKHLSQWPVAYISGDEELGSHVEDERLIKWLSDQVDTLASLALNKNSLQELLVNREDYARLNSELSLCWPCYQAWKQELKESKSIDFHQMITQATSHIEKRRYTANWKYILVDEYQDISPARVALIDALCKQESVETRLFAVGDDWQSIYQFTGSDVALTTDFVTRFTDASVTHLSTTYRFNNQIGDVANTFIQANPNQLPKTLESFNQVKRKSVVVGSQHIIEGALDEIYRREPKASVLFLGRNHYHKPDNFTDWQKTYPTLAIQYMTCHASKGKEADYVIICQVDEGQFPSKQRALHLDSALKQGNDPYPHAEERRLFYVALTRARKKVWVTYQASGSCFIKELTDSYPVVVKR